MQKERHSYLLDLITQRYFLWRQEINLTIADIYKQNVFIYQTWHSSIWTSLAFKGSLTMIHFKVIQQGRFFNILMVVGLANEIEHCLDNKLQAGTIETTAPNTPFHKLFYPQTPNSTLAPPFSWTETVSTRKKSWASTLVFIIALTPYVSSSNTVTTLPLPKSRLSTQTPRNTTITAKQAFNDDW